MRQKTSRALLAVLLAFSVVACDDADDPEIGDDNDPARTTIAEEMTPTTLDEGA